MRAFDRLEYSRGAEGVIENVECLQSTPELEVFAWKGHAGRTGYGITCPT